MPMTSQQIRNQLSAVEPDLSMYSGIGPSEIPALKRLLSDKEAWMASRAVFALSKIADARAVAILSETVGDSRPEVRVALASSIRNLKPKDANAILLRLLDDGDVGVRKFAVLSVSKAHDPAVQRKLKDVGIGDSAPPIRDMAKDRLRELKRRN